VNKNFSRTELYIRFGEEPTNVEKARQIFQALEDKKTELIGRYEYAETWDWSDQPEKIRRVRTGSIGYGIYDKEHWDELIEFLADSISKLKTAFDPLLNDIMKNAKNK